ncbi:MAG TPA: hypothetical protein VN709_01315 [Terriglobales bacterium]|nr:hypothetical protein [Terriglobales bacterium]
MAWLGRSLPLAPALRRPRAAGALAPPSGILASRDQAHPALLRMFGRARRRQAPLTLVRMAPDGAPPTATAEAGCARWLAELAAEMRINDLAWHEPGGVVMLLLEDATATIGNGTPSGLPAGLERLRERARQHGVAVNWRSAQFPQQGLTLQALLEEVAWRVA